jgi:hypothetical protein
VIRIERKIMPGEHLSTALFRETRGAGFFRILSGANAPFYVDVLDSLEREASERRKAWRGKRSSH